jgi:5-methylcytosine-specific restriction endonuclease McrA
MYKGSKKDKAHRAEFRKKNAKKIKKENAKYYRRNRKRILARNKAWNAAHPEIMNRITGDWAKENPQRVAEIRSEYHKRNKASRNAASKKYALEHPESSKARHNKRRTAKTKAGGSFSATEWKALCKKYKYKCLCCGRKRKLTADHVIPVSKGGTSNISNIQPLCGPCNSRKRDKTIDYRKGTHAST